VEGGIADFNPAREGGVDAEGVLSIDLDGLMAGGEDTESAALVDLEMEVRDADFAQDVVVAGVGTDEDATLLEHFRRGS